MDSTYWTVETIRTKAGLGDLSIAARRLKPYGRPDKLYNIYVDNGIVKTATRAYPDYEEEKWQDQFSLGSGTAVAICLDGYWELYRGKWQQVTSEKPWLFWVNGGRLYTQYWDETDTKLELATGVSKLKAIRGWANVNIMIQDQGVIVGYIKTDGKVYYRNYCRQANSSYIWENETQITEFTGTANTLNLFITNDYRTGFAVEDVSNKMYLFITGRVWAGMAIGKETFSARANLEIDFIPLQHHSRNGRENFCTTPMLEPSFLYASNYNKFKHIENIDNGEGDFGRKVRAVSKYRIFDLSIDDFKMTDCHDKDYTCVSVEEVGGGQYNWTYELEFTNFNNANCETTLLFNGLFGTNEAGFRFLEFDGEFLPTDLVPVQTPPPIVDEITNNEDREIIIAFDGDVFNVGEQIGRAHV